MTWLVVLAFLAAGFAPAPMSADAEALAGRGALSLARLLETADLAGVAARVNRVGDERACLVDDAFHPVIHRGGAIEDICFEIAHEEIDDFNAHVIEWNTEFIKADDCVKALIFVFSRHEGEVRNLFIAGQPHLVFHGPDYGWVLMPIADSAADHVRSGGLCEAG